MLSGNCSIRLNLYDEDSYYRPGSRIELSGRCFTMDIRSCRDCGKGIKSLSGLSRHRTRCPVLLGQRKRVVPKIYRQSPADKSSTESTHDGPDSVMSYGMQLNSCQPGGNEGSYEEDRDWIDINEDTGSSYLLVPPIQSRLLTTTSARIESYEEVTGKSAGQGFEDSNHMHHESGTRRPENYHPFRSETDFAAAQWFLSTGCTKGDIDRFFGDKHLTAMQNLLSFTSYDELLGKIHDISYGILNDIWNVTDIQVEQETIGLPPSIYQIRHRNIISVLEFLMGHEPFEHHLSYAPVRQFSGAGVDNRIYDEMHTGDWWWRTQCNIPDGGTIIPVLLASDKTMLSLHHGDQSAWPIYITIGNLDRKTRRSQKVPGSVLLGFLPITSETVDDSKARVYHAVMELILKRK